MTPTFPDDPRWQHEPRLVWEWYDLVCPFCYVAQAQSAALERRGLNVVELGFEIHPETPAGGRFLGPRRGPMYEALEEAARRAGLPLRWPDRIVNSRRALSAVEWVRQQNPHQAPAFRAALFRAHFVLSEDISDEAVVLRQAADTGVAVDALAKALHVERADELLLRSERSGRGVGVDSTPSWLLPVAGDSPEAPVARRRLVRGLLSREALEAIARSPPTGGAGSPSDR
jgi:predicted DsbA family dithiol-disulfide isomerase